MAKSRTRSTGKLVSWLTFDPKPMPYFAPEKCIRHPGQTDAQWAWQLEASKRHARMYSVALANFQVVATAYGYHKTCNKPECRRKKRCVGRRPAMPEDDYPRPFFPICSTIDMAERVIEGVREMCEIMRSGYVPMFAPDGSLHPGEEMVEDET
ncbi:hypothetical protein [Phyllobacterium lublinensis]|uniref:hypothetical protein n=1 Tax=Phyllobacterium lublinensis TaxID=2875708 RepID=UPI001CC984C4|nr:hypothetical protein [Phyllobacterium sp. 2063]MBZ9653874.1 hypothetical protein [Phyllobacterium sp. 2063]